MKVYPNAVEFKDVERHHKYEMTIHVRNESKENQKLRIIHPNKSYFKVYVESNQMNIAPGLAIKMIVLFYLDIGNTFDDFDEYRDELIILGNNFKT